MATQVFDLAATPVTDSTRTLLLVWQNPATRRFITIGRLDTLRDTRYAFHYLPEAALETAFAPLSEYPDFNALYVSDEVPAFFANRVLSADRPGYSQYLEWLGIADLDEADVPVEVLVRTGGGRATDTFHIVERPSDDADTFASRFFVSGIRHTDDAESVVGSLSNGSVLSVQLEKSNPKNQKAVLVNTDDGRKVGYVPDWLCGDVFDRLESGWTITVAAERVNPDAPAHIRVLCALRAHVA